MLASRILSGIATIGRSSGRLGASITRQRLLYTAIVEQQPHAPRIMITGGSGQLGRGLAERLRGKYGANSVLLTDVVAPSQRTLDDGPFEMADVLDADRLQALVSTYRVNWLIHFSALLSAVGESNIPLAVQVNINGVHNILNVARDFGLRLFIPSTIGAFGSTSPSTATPDFTIQRPQTIYGVSKVHAELMGEYYNAKFGLDFRCLRLPGVLSADTPGGGTTDYAIHIFFDALQKRTHNCFLHPDSRLPMIHIDDCLRGITELMEAPAAALNQRTYNQSAIDFTPRELAAQLAKYVPSLQVTYNPDFRQGIADSWPNSLDDSNARRDWGWKHHIGLDELVRVMLRDVGERLEAEAGSMSSDEEGEDARVAQ